MGKPVKKQVVGLLVLGAGLIMMFQNMTLIEFSLRDVPAVDEGARRDQARELLGSYYTESPARKVEGERYLNYLIFKEIEKSLGLQWKHRALELTQTLIAESRKMEFDPIFILAVIRTESQFNPNAKGSAGELGLMQILPPTGEWIAKKYRFEWQGDRTLYDPVTNIQIGIRYFDYLRSQFDGTAYNYLPAYNMGPKNVRRVNREIASVDANGVPVPRIYAAKVMKNYHALYEQLIQEQNRLVQYARATESDFKSNQ